MQVNIFNDDGKKKRQTSSTDKENSAPAADEAAQAEKSETEIQQEIQSLFRQITASVTFLPMLDGNCTFNVLVYADADSEVPLEWGDSDAKEVKNAEKVMLRSFSTNSHRIDTVVSYRFVEYCIVNSPRGVTDKDLQIGGLIRGRANGALHLGVQEESRRSRWANVGERGQHGLIP